jgi:GAF domain-containing protein
VVAIQLIVYGYLIIFANNILVDTYNWAPAIANFISVFLIALTFVPVRKWLLALVNSLFFSKTISTKAIIQEVREKISGSVEFDKLFASLTAEIEKVVAVKETKYFIVNKRARVFDRVGGGQTMPPEASLPQWFKDTQNIIVRDEIPYLVQELPIVNQPLLERCQKELEDAHSEMAIPFGSKNNLLGFALLGEKANGESYTKEEIDLLQAVGREATYALDGAILYKEALERIGVTK